MRRIGWVLLLVAMIVTVLLLAIRRGNGSAVEVTLEPVGRVEVFRSTVTASGQIVATRYADIGSNVMGKIVALPVREGDRVRAGQLLARIDPVQARADVTAAQAAVQALAADASAAERATEAAQAELAGADARAQVAAVTLDRTRELHGQGLAPKADLDAARAAADTAAAQVRAAAAALERARSARGAASQRIAQSRAQADRARDVLGKTEITAPIDGVVSRLQVREGEMVVIGIQNQPGTTLMTVSDLSAIDAEVKVAEADVLRLEVGQPATVVLEAIPNRRFGGRVVEVGASALPVVGTQAAAREFRVVVRLDDADASLRPGLTCDAEILTEERRNVLTVPLQSVVLRPAAGAAAGPGAAEQSGVFTVRDNAVSFRPVTTGIIGGLSIEVSGIDEGTQVVTGPFQALRGLQDGARIRVRQQPGS
ncbi:MAG: efflux RND transporter periplasmic adaptor subunit [Vicinamibacterales bacterium]|nr:efflux RND transporter periplasmic adaptor subunit [Vicinamibacterales bacterium]